jgi:DNA modification methylase
MVLSITASKSVRDHRDFGILRGRKGGAVKPYFERDGVVIYHSEALDTLRQLPDASIDAIITDPPYCSGAVGEAQRTAAPGQGLRSENLHRFGWFQGDNMGTAGLVWLLRSMAFEAMRVVKPTGSLLVFCDWRMVSSIQPAIESAGLRFQDLIVWDKGSMGLGAGFRKQHELILHFTMGEPAYHDKGTANVLACPRVPKARRKHQAEKPVPLIRRLLRVVCPPGGVILDPFMGSGPVGEAAIGEGRTFIGIERNSEHCNAAIGRIPQMVLPLAAD